MHTARYATSHLRASAEGRRARAPRGRLALVRRLCPPPVPDPAGQRPRRAGPGHRQAPGLRRPDRARGAPRLQRPRRGCPAAGLPEAHDDPGRLRPAGCRAAAGAAAPEPARLRQADQPVDAGPGGRGQLRARLDRHPRQRRDDPPDPQTARRALATGEALDHQPGSRVRAKKSARDRLIRLAASRPTWALGFEDEVWWSRLARPALSSWAGPDQPLRWVEQVVAKDDPDPKATT